MGKLWARGFFRDVTPVNFLTIATPHLGCWESPNSMGQLVGRWQAFPMRRDFLVLLHCTVVGAQGTGTGTAGGAVAWVMGRDLPLGFALRRHRCHG